MNLFTVTMIGVGGMIGAGIFVLTGIAAGEAGAAVIYGVPSQRSGHFPDCYVVRRTGFGSSRRRRRIHFHQGSNGGNRRLPRGLDELVCTGSSRQSVRTGFGRFAAELIQLTGFPNFGLTVDQLTLGFMTIIIITFIFINSLGASETAAAGNILTLTKIAILSVLVAFGLAAIAGTDLSQAEISTDFFSHGVIGVLSAMGLTFIAFEGYEIIAQSGEEVINPKRNIPIAIFVSIAIAVVIYILVAFVAIGRPWLPRAPRSQPILESRVR